MAEPNRFDQTIATERSGISVCRRCRLSVANAMRLDTRNSVEPYASGVHTWALKAAALKGATVRAAIVMTLKYSVPTNCTTADHQSALCRSHSTASMWP